MKKVLFTLLILLMPAFAQAYEVISEETTIDGIFSHTETVVAASEDPIDRFTMHRYKNRFVPSWMTQRVLILVPGLQSEFDMYLDGFAQAVALAGIEVWGLTPRAANLSAACETDPASCAISGTWGMDTYIDDTIYIRDALETTLPGRTVVMGGVSLGAMVPVAVVNEDPYRYDGLFLLDGFLYSADPVIINHNAPYCGMLDAMVGMGLYYDGTLGQISTLIMTLAQTDPDGPSPIMPGLTNRQALIAFFDTLPPFPDAPVSCHPDAHICVGDVMAGEFYYADEEKLFYGIETFMPYIPFVITRDFLCAMAAHPLYDYTYNLSAYEGAIYAAGGTEGMGGHMADELALFVNADITEAFEIGYGHMDPYFSKTRFCDLTLPLLSWLYSL